MKNPKIAKKSRGLGAVRKMPSADGLRVFSSMTLTDLKVRLTD